MRYNKLSVLLIFFGTLCMTSAFAHIEYRAGGNWPKNWPEELEVLRPQSKTGYASGATPEATYYEIPFNVREDFEKAWPAIVRLTSKESTLILCSPGESAVAQVTIRCPAGAKYKRLGSGEYVISERPSPLQPEHQTQVDVILAIDGKVIDLNRIRFPDNIRVIDYRNLVGDTRKAKTGSRTPVD